MNVFVDEGKSFEDFYTLLEKIGEGAHAIVRKAIKNDNKAIVNMSNELRLRLKFFGHQTQRSLEQSGKRFKLGECFYILT